jgi:hypothetical protein
MLAQSGARLRPWLTAALAAWAACGVIRADDTGPEPAGTVTELQEQRPSLAGQSMDTPSNRGRASIDIRRPETRRTPWKSRLRRLLDQSLRPGPGDQRGAGRPPEEGGEGTPPAIIQPGTPGAPEYPQPRPTVLQPPLAAPAAPTPLLQN